MVSATWFQSVAALPAGAFLAVVVVVLAGPAVVVVAPGAAGAAGAGTTAAGPVVVVESSPAGAAVVVVVGFSTTTPATTGLLSLWSPRRRAMAWRALLIPSVLRVMRSRPLTCSATMTPLAVSS